MTARAPADTISMIDIQSWDDWFFGENVPIHEIAIPAPSHPFYDLRMDTPLDDAALTAFLEGQDSAWLAEQLMLAAEEDPITRIRLSGAAGAESAVEEARAVVLAHVTDHLPSEEELDDGDPLHRALDLLDDLVEYGFEEEVGDIAEEARETYVTRHGEDDGEHLARLHVLADGDGDDGDQG